MITHINGLQGRKLDEVAAIWLAGNLDAHWFIAADYWRNYSHEVKTEIGTSELFLSEANNKVNGFLGLVDGYIAVLFVAKKFRGHQIGTQLMTAVKQTRSKLSLSVYQKKPVCVSLLPPTRIYGRVTTG